MLTGKEINEFLKNDENLKKFGLTEKGLHELTIALMVRLDESVMNNFSNNLYGKITG